MFWFKGTQKDESGKEKQIRDLSNAFPSVKRPNQDDNMFELVFEIDRKYNTLRIYLPSDFPTSKPGITKFMSIIKILTILNIILVLQVIGPVIHPWLDQYKRVVGCDKVSLESFVDCH
jgi:hypothetical protein